MMDLGEPTLSETLRLTRHCARLSTFCAHDGVVPVTDRTRNDWSALLFLTSATWKSLFSHLFRPCRKKSWNKLGKREKLQLL